MTVKPLADRILVKRLEEEDKIGSIIVPDTAKEKSQKAEVIAVGEGRRTDEGKLVSLEVKKGDKLLIGKYAGTDIKIDGEEYIIMKQEDVMGIFKN
ncbi:MAG: co-chaperone GroES [bacterium]|nr:co-chaperone GroES [bacterium]MDO9465343.1 co-chaperone GroES [bacterium]